jgi:hypothetical protein
MTIILAIAAGAIMTAHLTSTGGTAFTKREASAGGIEASVQDVNCAGGETLVVLTLSGADNVSGYLYAIAAGVTFSSGCNASTGVTPTVANDHVPLPTAALTVAAASIVVSVFGYVATAGSWFGYGPPGKQYANLSHQTGTGTKFIWMSGLADITAAASYPAAESAGNYKPLSQLPYATTGTMFAAHAAYTDTSGVLTNPAPANGCVGENSLPGTDHGNWFASGFVDGTIAGFCDKLSYNPGDTVSFKVDSTVATGFHVEIYRLGFYGAEVCGARSQLGMGTTTEAGYITGTATAQSASSVDGTLGSASCSWTTDATWTIPANARTGVYWVIFRRTDVTTDFSSGTFIVKAPSAAGKVAVVLADFTWNAYNLWGATSDHGALGVGVWSGRNVYQIGGDGASGNSAHRAYAVSFDRPKGTVETQPQTDVLDTEQPVITFLEGQGYDLVYYSCVDLENDTSATLLNQAKMVVLIGHQEYWTTNVYNSLRAAMNAGVPFMIQSSNTALWHTRFAAADTNKRTMICYKDSLTVDVNAGFTGTGRDPVSYTGTWRDTRTAVSPNNPDFRVETAFQGQHFLNGNLTSVQQSVPFASKGMPLWRNSASIQALGSGAYTVAITGNGAGYEFDAPDGTTGSPSNLVSLNPFSAGTLTNGANLNGTIYTSTITPTGSFSLYRRYASRALIFDTGAWRGWWGVTRFAASSYANASFVTTPDVNWQNALLAVMYDLGAAPVTLTNMKPNVDTAVTNPATGALVPLGDKTGVARAYGLTCPEDGQFMATVL